MLNSLDNLLKNILLSHVVVKEIPNSDSNNTLVRIHLIPLNNKIKNKIKNQRDKHVSHLPKYKKILENLKEDDEPCSICLSSFNKGEYYRKLPICKHMYHKKCIDKWFKKDIKNMKCPICRTSHTKEKYKKISN